MPKRTGRRAHPSKADKPEILASIERWYDRDGARQNKDKASGGSAPRSPASLDGAPPGTVKARKSRTASFMKNDD